MRKTNDITRTLRRPFACFALCALALAGAMSETGCRKIVTPAQKGDNVLFSAGVGGSESGTKTAYTNSNSSDRSLAENINWLSGDQIRIWCAECSEPTTDTYGNADHWADYTVTPESTATQGKIAVNPGTVGLRWGDVETQHYFYAVYPSPNTTGKNSDAGEFGTSPVFKFTGHIPAKQTISGSLTPTEPDTEGKTTTIAAPDMSNLYMVSKTAATPESNPEVFLSFRPLSTAIQFTIVNGLSGDKMMQVESVKIMSDPKPGSGISAKNLAGAFEANLSGTWTKPSVSDPVSSGIAYAYANDYPSCNEPTDKTGQSTELSIDFTGTAANNPGIAKGKELQFTFFLLPTQSIDDLSFVITRKEGESGHKTIKTRLELANGGKVTFPAHKKTYVTGILVPDGQTVTFSNITIGDWGAGQSEDVEIEEIVQPNNEIL